MKRLCELVDIGVNNEVCVLFKVKENARMDLIALGCFRGDEDMIRMTKGRQPEITLYYKDGGTMSYYFGEGGHTVLSGSGAAQREMIRECAILDFGIVCDWSYMPNDIDFDRLVSVTSDIKSLKDAYRTVTLVSGGGMSGNIRVNSQGMELRIDVKDIPKWFEKRGYHVEFDRDISQGLPCGQVYGEFSSMKDYQISQMPHELSEDRLVRYVQEELLCDNDRALEFIKGFNDARLIRDAKKAMRYYTPEIAQAGLSPRKLEDEDLLKLGNALYRLECAAISDYAETEVDVVLNFLKQHQSKSVDGLISEACERSADATKRSEAAPELGIRNSELGKE